jgi:hypothetical protein
MIDHRKQLLPGERQGNELPSERQPDATDRRALPLQCGAAMLLPDLAGQAAARATWAARGCAPLVLDGPTLARARRHFLQRAAALGHRRTRNPALRVVACDRSLHAELNGARRQIRLPASVTQVWLISRTWVPAYMRPTEDDARILGVAVARMWLDAREVALDSPALMQGWHTPEAGWRWTDGVGVLPVAGARRLEFDLAMVGEYWAKLPTQ